MAHSGRFRITVREYLVNVTGQRLRAKLGLRCRTHTEFVLGMLSGGDTAGAYDYLRHVEGTDGVQMRRNVTDLISLTLGILPPELR
jgi:hypothetical protein